MSISLKAVDRLFERLAATYPNWSSQWRDVPESDVKTAWAHELSGFQNNLHALAWALENLPERCPNVIEFRNLARRAPEIEKPRLPEPKADPARLKAELAKLSEIKAQVKNTKVDHKAWAKAILKRHSEGIKINITVLSMARSAMNQE
jgi:hypothetical protein